MGLVPEVLKNAHNDPLASHGGIHKTWERLRSYYYSPRLLKDEENIQACETCKMTKAPNRTLRPPMGRASEPARPFQKLYVDSLGPYRDIYCADPLQ